jgi:Ca2+-binding EF-hand superfamily protein
VKKSKDTGSYEDFIECLKLYDKMENGTMMLGELEHILLSLGEKLGKFNIKRTLPPDFLLYTYCIRTFPTGYAA